MSIKWFVGLALVEKDGLRKARERLLEQLREQENKDDKGSRSRD